MKNLLIFFAICFLINPLTQADSQLKTIYDNDDRVEVEDHPDALLRDYSDSVAAMVRDYRLLDTPPNELQSFEKFKREQYSVLGQDFFQENPKYLQEAYNSYLLQVASGASSSRAVDPDKKREHYYFNLNRTLERYFKMCPGERFAKQAVLSNCTGFLVAPDLLMTAGHCVESDFQCKRFRWVFGHKKGVKSFPSEDVYRCEKIVASELTGSVFSTRDYALIKLDRVVKERTPLPVRTRGYVDKDEPLAVIGHPSGLPMKIADNARVTSRRINFFYSNLDTFSGNSGSPVINTRTGLVEGILIQGASDFVTTVKGCQVSRLHNLESGDDEKVFRLPRVDDLEEFVNGEKSY
jgi:hypothetical protein